MSGIESSFHPSTKTSEKLCLYLYTKNWGPNKKKNEKVFYRTVFAIRKGWQMPPQWPSPFLLNNNRRLKLLTCGQENSIKSGFFYFIVIVLGDFKSEGLNVENTKAEKFFSLFLFAIKSFLTIFSLTTIEYQKGFVANTNITVIWQTWIRLPVYVSAKRRSNSYLWLWHSLLLVSNNISFSNVLAICCGLLAFKWKTVV